MLELEGREWKKSLHLKGQLFSNRRKGVAELSGTQESVSIAVE